MATNSNELKLGSALPLSLNLKQMDKMGLKTGPARTDVLTHKAFPTSEAIEEVTRLGFYSGFYDIRAALKEHRGATLLVVADLDSRYGENWYVCMADDDIAAVVTDIQLRNAPAALDTSLGPDAAATGVEDGEIEAGEAEEEEMLVFDESEAARVHDAPVQCGPYRSDTSAATEAEIAASYEQPSRPPLALRINRKRSSFGGPVTLHDSMGGPLVAEWRSRRDPSYGTLVCEHDSAVQAGAPGRGGFVDSAAQTAWRPKASAAVQADAAAEAHERAAQAAAAADALVAGVDAFAAATVIPALLRAGQHAHQPDAASESLRERAPARAVSSDPDSLRAAIRAAAAAAAAFETGSSVPTPAVSAGGLGASLSSSSSSSTTSARRPGGGSGGGGGASGGRSSSAAGASVHESLASGRGRDAGCGGAGGAHPAGRLMSFLSRVAPLVEDALAQNAAMDVAQDGLAVLLGPAGAKAYRAEVAAREAGSSGGGSDGTGEGGGGRGSDGGGPSGSSSSSAGIAGTGVREERQLMDLELSSGRTVTCVEWHPKAPAVPWVAVAVQPSLPFESRLAASLLPAPSHVLLFALGDFAVQVVLEAPSAVTALHWCPWAPGLLAAGLASGQVCVFDLGDATSALAAKRSSEAQTSGGGGGDGAGGDDPAGVGSSDGGGGPRAAVRVRPKLISAAEASHGGPPVTVRWLPPSHHLSHKHVFGPAKEGPCSQLLSVGADGCVAVWDTTKDKRAARRRHRGAGGGAGDTPDGGPDLLQSSLIPGAAAAGVLAPSAELPWTPLYRLPLLLPVACCAVPRRASDPLLVGTHDGRVAAVNWAPLGEGTETQAWALTGGGGAKPGAAAPATTTTARAATAQGAVPDPAAGGEGGSPLLWVSVPRRGSGPVCCIAISPFLPDTLLTACDYSFSLWRAGCTRPLFTSPPAPCPLAGCAWSPTRPSVLLITRSDGTVDVWDLSESTASPALCVPLVSHPLCAMQFAGAGAAAAASGPAPPLASRGGVGTANTAGGGRRPGGAFGASSPPAPPSASRQLLAVGDSQGAVHVLDLPGPLRRGPPGEEGSFAAYLSREAARVDFTAAQSVQLGAAQVKREAAAAAAAADAECRSARLEGEIASARCAMRDRDPGGAERLDAEGLEAAKAAARAAVEQQAYEELERAAMAQLGISPDELRLLTTAH